jgi:ribose 5-phosphate isomerase A
MKIASPEQLAVLGMHAARLVLNHQRVGLGSGKASLAFVRALGKRLRDEKLDIVGVPTSIQTERVARELGIPLKTLSEIDALDLTIDGADEVDPKLNLIKGGGGYLTREKVVASISRRFVIVVGEEKMVAQLGTRFPVFVEVLEFARAVVTRRIEALGAVVTPRKNPDGSNYVTDNGNPYLHCQFPPPPKGLGDPAELDRFLHAVPGIIETALFIDMANEVLVAYADGHIEHQVKSEPRP